MPTSHPNKKIRIASLSMVASLAVAVLKFGAAILTGSLALLSEAFHSLVDVTATLLTLLAVRISDKPADATHHFGHAKIESLAALFEIGLLIAIAGWFTYEGVNRLVTGQSHVEVTWWAIAILLVSIAVDLNRSFALRKVGRETGSVALSADASHFESDMYGSVAVLIGLIGVWLGFQWADIAATFAVTLLVLFVAWKLTKDTLATLIDAAPEGVSEKLAPLMEAVPGVLAVYNLRIRPAGAVHFVTAEVNVPRTLPAADLGNVKRKLEDVIRAELPTADIVISAEPVEIDNESIFEKSMLIATQHGRTIHHLTVQKLEDRAAISFDCEFDGSTRLSEAHAKATELEGAIRQALGGTVEVESHIEPLPFRSLDGQRAGAAETKRIAAAIRHSAKPEKLLSDIHSIRVRYTDGGHFVHYHCRFAGQTTVQDVHDAVDRVEQRLTKRIPTIKRVIAHAEPIGHSAHAL